MKSLRNRMLLIAAFASTVVFASAMPASAQGVFQGSFTLTHEVHWQNATLPPGDYTFRVDSAATPARLTVKGSNGSQFVTAIVADQKTIQQSTLIIENRGSRSDVCELRLAGLNRSLRYGVPKAPKDIEVAQGPVTREQIIVAMNVK